MAQRSCRQKVQFFSLQQEQVHCESTIQRKKVERVNKYSTKATSKYFTLANINLQSLSNKIDNFTYFLNEQNIDLGCITEHWLSSDVVRRVFIENYVVASAYCHQSSRHGGAAIILRNNVSVKEVTEIKKLSSDEITEMTAVRIAERNLTVVAIYRPPSGDFETFITIMNQALQICMEKYPRDKLVFAGDYNVNFRGQSNEKNKIIEIWIMCFLTHHMKRKVQQIASIMSLRIPTVTIAKLSHTNLIYRTISPKFLKCHTLHVLLKEKPLK